MPFACSICGEESTQICARCTKDACDNHFCPKCRRCSDCCECEVALNEPVHEAARVVVRSVVSEPESTAPELEPEPEPELELGPEPGPEREPEPETEPEPEPAAATALAPAAATAPAPAADVPAEEDPPV